MESGTVIAMMLLWLVPVLLIAWMIGAASNRTLAQGTGHSLAKTSDPVLELAREKYARGEISGREYQRMLERYTP